MRYLRFSLGWTFSVRRLLRVGAVAVAGVICLLFQQPLCAQTSSLYAKRHDAGRVVEDWSSPALTKGQLVPVEPLLGECDVFPDFTRDMMQLQWRPFDPIHLYIIRPTGVEKPPVVLYLYSYPSDTDRFLDTEYCRRVTSKGVAAVGFVSALTGQRYQMRPMREWFVSELPEALASSAHDVQLILDYLATRGDLDLSRVGMFGEGSGAAIAILAAAADPRIKVLDLINPWGDWKAWLTATSLVPASERKKYLTPEFLKKAALLDPTHWLSHLQERRIRLQLIRGDPTNPDASLSRVMKAAPRQTRVDRYPDLKAYYEANSHGRVFDWIHEQLGSYSGQTPPTTIRVEPQSEESSRSSMEQVGISNLEP